MKEVLSAAFEKRFGTEAVIQVDLQQRTREFSITVLFGPSGCGKTTTLRCLGGLDRPQQGHIRFGPTTWFDSSNETFLSPQQRDIGFLFQDYALFPHLTVVKNIAFGLAALPRSEQRRRVSEMLDLFDLKGLAERYPHEASGGQQQRIALARVLVRRPQLLLLDEPLSALDGPTRERIRPDLRRLLSGFGIPVFVVTHDRIEAMTLADSLLVMEHGKVRQQGAPQEVFARPVDVGVARIVGVETVEAGRILSVEAGLATISLGASILTAAAPEKLTDRVHACIRAEEVLLERTGRTQEPWQNQLAAYVLTVSHEGPMVRVKLECGFPLVALVTRQAWADLGAEVGEQVTAVLDAKSIHLMD